MSRRGPLLIVGASGRAAAASALRAEFDPFVIDLFADADTKRLAPTVRCPLDRYPDALPELAARLPPGPFIYTGGLENHPSILAALSSTRPLLGNDPSVLSVVRSPHRLNELLADKGLAHARVFGSGGCQASDVLWLRKPLTGSGGFGIRFATDEDITRSSASGGSYYLQRFIPGRPMSALYASFDGHTARIGLTRQLVGETWLHAGAFRYAGNIGPILPPNEKDCDTFFHAFRLSHKAGVRGVWGFDFVPFGGEPNLIEVNPRYTASLEILEFAHRTAFLSWHAESVAGWPPAGFALPRATRVVAKAVYYAPHRFTFPGSGPWDDSLAHCTDVWQRPDYADIPDPGTVVEPGQPVLTVLADGESEEDCLSRLKSRAVELDHLFGYVPSAEPDP